MHGVVHGFDLFVGQRSWLFAIRAISATASHDISEAENIFYYRRDIRTALDANRG